VIDLHPIGCDLHPPTLRTQPAIAMPIHLTLGVILASALASLGICACGPPALPRPLSPAPDPTAGPLAPANFSDINADPRIVEVNLEARVAEWEIAPGRRIRAWTYNGSVPGPVLRANVGDTVIVHFTNRLDEPTTIHWHGLRVPADMDGSPHSQSPVPPGGAFDYRFTVPDAGTFWYHPHANEQRQMEMGLYGAVIVRGDDEPVSDVDSLVVLDDLTLGPDGQIAPVGDVLEQHNGRQGSALVVNGRLNADWQIRAGQRQRWRIINAGSARFYRLSLEGHRFRVIGSDGGSIGEPRVMDELFLVPGDRLDVIVDGMAAPGSIAALRNLPYDRGHGAGISVPEDVMIVRYTNEPALVSLPLPARRSGPERLPQGSSSVREIRFHERIDRVNGRVVFMINGRSYPDVPDIETRVGATETWDLINESEMEHPFHLHGFFFQVLSRNGIAESVSTWEDTIQLRGLERVRIVFRIDGRPGAWMYHCHILEHVDNGMMATMHVAP